MEDQEYSDYKDWSAQDTEFRLVQQFDAQRSAAREAFKKDPFAFAQGRAMDRVQKEQPELSPHAETSQEKQAYVDAMFAANIKSQEELSGGRMPYQVMTQEEAGQFQTTLFGDKDQHNAPFDPNAALDALASLRQRFKAPDHFATALTQLGVERSLAPVLPTLGDDRQVLSMLQSLKQSEGEQVAALSSRYGKSSDPSASARTHRDIDKKNLMADRRVRALFGSKMYDPAMQGQIQEVIGALATSLKMTGQTTQDFSDHLKRNFRTVTAHADALSAKNNPTIPGGGHGLGGILEDAMMWYDIISPFGGVPFTDATDARRVNVVELKSGGGLTTRQAEAFKENDIWAGLISRATGIRSGTDIGQLFDDIIEGGGTENLRKNGVKATGLQQTFDALRINNVWPDGEGNLMVRYSQNKDNAPTIGKYNRPVKMTRDQFQQFAKTRSEKLIKAMFNTSELVGGNGSYYLKNRDQNGRTNLLPIPKAQIFDLVGQQTAQAREWNNAVERPASTVGKHAFEAVKAPTMEVLKHAGWAWDKSWKEIGKPVIRAHWDILGEMTDRAFSPLYEEFVEGTGVDIRLQLGADRLKRDIGSFVHPSDPGSYDPTRTE